jgi:hypothetical protein
MSSAATGALPLALLAALAFAGGQDLHVTNLDLTHRLALPQPAKPPAAARPAPAWVGSYFKAMAGIWITDNAAYRSEAEPLDAYGMEWKPGPGGKSLVGRLYGIRAGVDVGTFWEFREFWHPGEGELVASQFGNDGTYGVGPHRRKDGGTMEMLQTFYDPAGAVRRVGHRSALTANELVTTSFDVQTDGTWKERRRYVWRRKALVPR